MVAETMKSEDDCVRMPRQDKESARVLIGFMGQSLPGRAPRHEQGKSGGLQPVGKGAAPIYPGDTEAAGPFRIWLESGSRVLIGLLSRVGFS